MYLRTKNELHGSMLSKVRERTGQLDTQTDATTERITTAAFTGGKKLEH